MLPITRSPLAVAEFGLDGAHEFAADHGDVDPIEHISEEPQHNEASRLILGDPPRAQVEQLLLVETAGRTGVTGAHHVPGEDLQVGHRVRTRPVVEQQVPVDLVGLRAHGAGLDQHVADPHAAGTLTLERALEHHVAAAVRLIVVDEGAVFEALTGVGEVQPSDVRVTAGTVVVHGLDQARGLTAEGHDHRAQGGVATHPGRQVAGMDGVVVPRLHADELQAGAFLDDHRHIAGVHRGPEVAQGDGRAGTFAHLDEDPAPHDGLAACAGQVQDDGFGMLGTGWDLQQNRSPGVLGRQCGDPVDGGTRRTGRPPRC
jgi:hypothetical protein